MIKKQGTFSTLILLFFFLSTILFINFLHTEECIKTSDYCPACKFQNSAFSTDFSPSFILPQLTLLESLKPFEIAHYRQLHLIIPSSRSPPLI